MPFIRTTISKKLTNEEITKIKSDFGRSIGIVSGKSESVLMLAFHDGVDMAYKGDMDNDCAMVEVSLLGEADPSELNDLTAAITDTLVKVAGLDAARVYVNYLAYRHWGVSGRNV